MKRNSRIEVAIRATERKLRNSGIYRTKREKET